jgi:glycosyltransferase involved in cell wall biosynthesis
MAEPPTAQAFDFQQDASRSDRWKVLFVGHGRTRDQVIRQKWDSLSDLLEIRVVIESDDPELLHDSRFLALRPIRSSIIAGLGFYARLPHAIYRELKRRRPDVIVTQSPYDALPVLLALALSGLTGVPLIIEVHGDWRTATRLYGSRLRSLLSPLGDLAAVWALGRATTIRAIGPAMSSLAEEAAAAIPVAVFPTFYDAETYFSTPPEPLPDTPTALWVGVLQRYKNPELLADAWDLVATAVADARLVVVGSGPLEPIAESLRSKYPDRVRVYSRLSPAELKREFDSATTLVLPSRSEGLGRVIIEAHARGRPVIGTRVGGIPDLVAHEVNGLLIPSDDLDALAESMIRLLRDRELASRLGRRGRADVEAHRWTPERYANAMFDLVQVTLARSENAGP